MDLASVSGRPRPPNSLCDKNLLAVEASVRFTEMLPDSTPAVYFPIERGVYELGPGFKPLGYDFGNGLHDADVFQLDRDFKRYRSEKLAAREENIEKYFGVDRLAPEVQSAAVDFILNRAVSEHPAYFRLELMGTTRTLVCALTGEVLSFSPAGELISAQGQNSTPPYSHAIDALMSQFQEDAAIVSTSNVGGKPQNWMSLMHVCGPSHWDPREKLGRDFLAVHAPIPGFEKAARAHLQIIDAMVNKGPFVRFVWSFVTDVRLNHHPEPAFGADPALWKGRSFNLRPDGSAPFHLRVERQTTVGLPAAAASLFFIRLSFIDGNQLKKNKSWNSQLVSALQSMTPESRAYKGVAGCFDDLVGWLET
jgi:hypothetical protein